MFIKVKVTAGSKAETILKKTKDSFDISVREKAEKNMANDRVKKILERHFLKGIKLVKGAKQKNKIFETIG